MDEPKGRVRELKVDEETCKDWGGLFDKEEESCMVLVEEDREKKPGVVRIRPLRPEKGDL